ncbi:MAG: hypothetical protein WBZ27_02290, partial [Pseudolabrys sp.]
MTKGSTWSILCCRLMHVPHTGCNVRFGSKAESAQAHVRFTPNSGHRPDRRLNSSGQDFIKILRGGVQDFIKIALDQKRPPPLVEPPFESFDFAFEPNR